MLSSTRIKMKFFSLVILSLMLSMTEGQGRRKRQSKPPTMPPTGEPTTKPTSEPTESSTSPPVEVGSGIANFIIELLASDVDPNTACKQLAELIGGQVGYVFIGLFTGCEIIPSMVSTMSVTEMSELLAAASGVKSVTQDGPIEGYD